MLEKLTPKLFALFSMLQNAGFSLPTSLGLQNNFCLVFDSHGTIVSFIILALIASRT
ncbi:hypothetical protein HanXRQr2_Chr05g0227521 [Helianthus annuus]|uniref:Uncharacterized protein n=1 Tax=Helianthus annuus TaxID=4232 RepID=A0A9K3J368_HELAN|nr:hypothetical protein HanXRQr2_Chr05g0227521 [Helianthus annuus]KAJ0923738.1 hypothetical protein HanPSC8_Chr05g0219561 [Helianthus annuus]